MVAGIVGGLLTFAMFFLGFPDLVILVVDALVGSLYFVWRELPRMKAMRVNMVSTMYSTEWAKSQGFTPENLRLYKFPWSK